MTDTECDSIGLRGFTPPSREPIDVYLEQNVELGQDSDMTGRISFDQLPMQRYLLRACQDASIPKVIAMVASQCTKTTSLLLYLIWKIKNAPSPCGWFTDRDKAAKELSQTRISTFLRSCNSIAEEWPRERSARKWGLYQLNSMNLYVRGLESQAQAEQISCQTVLCDERRNYKPGRMQSVRNRYKSFRKFKEISVSVAGEEKDEMTQAWNTGTRTFFHWSCLHCGHRQPFRFGRRATPLFTQKRECGGVIWETSAITRPKEFEWDREAVMDSVRYECENPKCKHHYHNWEKPRLIATMNESNDFGAVHTNPMSDGDTVSMHWNELYMPWDECDWPKIAWKFIQADIALKLNRNVKPLKIFVQESDGCPWRDIAGEKAEASTILARCGEYSIGEEWPPEKKCGGIITVDVQHGYLLANYSQWSTPHAEKRLVETLKVIDYDELRAYQVGKKVKDCAVGIDSGWGAPSRKAELYAACLRYGRWRRGANGVEYWDGWLPMLGDDAKEFSHKEEGETVKTFWKMATIDANIGYAGRAKMLQRCSWSKSHYRDLVFRHLIPGVLPGWEVPKDIAAHRDGDYIDQMGNVERRDILDAEGNVIDHEWVEHGRHDDPDCECMQTVMAEVCGIGRTMVEKKKET